MSDSWRSRCNHKLSNQRATEQTAMIGGTGVALALIVFLVHMLTDEELPAGGQYEVYGRLLGKYLSASL